MSVLFNTETGRWEEVADADVAAGIESGRLISGGGQRMSGDGYSAVRTPEEAAELSGLLGESQDITAEATAANDAAAGERRAAFDTVGAKALTFAEGAVDALTFGLVHGRGAADDFRREVNSGSALLGQLAGTAVGMGLPGIGTVARVGEAGGRALAKALLGEATEGVVGRVLVRGAEEAAIGAGLMGSTAVGHQVGDAIIEDKAFSGAAVVHEAGLGALLGFGAGLLSGGFRAAASRGDIAAQGGLVNGTSIESIALTDELRGVRDAYARNLDEYAGRQGVLDVLVSEGQVPAVFGAERKAALDAARAAGKRLNELDLDAALNGDAREYGKYRSAMADYRAKAEAADALFREPHPLERLKQVRPGAPAEYPAPRVNTGGVDDEWAMGLDDMMAKNPGARARYAELHGREWEPVAVRTPSGPVVGEGGLGDAAPAPFREDFATPEAGTRAGKRPAGAQVPFMMTNDMRAALRARGVSDAAIAEMTPARAHEVLAGRAGFSQRINGGVTGAFERGELNTARGPVRPASTEIPPSGEYTIAEPVRSQLDLMPEIAPPRSGLDNAAAFDQFRQARAIEEAQLAGFRPDLPEPNMRIGEDRVGVSPLEKFEGARTVKTGRPEMTDQRTIVDRNVPRGEVQDATYVDKGVPRGEPLPKEPREPKTQKYIETPEEPTTVRPRDRSAHVQKYLDDWYLESQRLGPRLSPGDAAAVRLDSALRKLEAASGGRLNSAGSLELGERLGLKPINDMLIDRLDQIWALRKAARFAADEARGITTPLSGAKRSITDDAMRRFMRHQGAAMGAAYGGPLGAAFGWVIGGQLEKGIGFGARAAASAGRLKRAVLEAGARVLSGRRASVAARAAAGNRAYAYDETGPVQDPIERIRTIHRLAANPEKVRAAVRNQLGDVALSHPEVAGAIEDTAVRQVTNLSLRAPAIYFDQLNRAVQPTAGALRRFYEYENATHDVTGLLNSVGRGAITPVQVSALWEQHREVHAVLARALMDDPEALSKKPTAEIRAVEALLGIPLTAASSDPGYIARTQTAWQSQAQPPSPGKPQAFKITAPPPTRVQANATGVAPGNEQQ